MSWILPSHEHKVFKRNPLVAVVVELRFQPILKVPDRIADFQERVRGTFPAYETYQRQVVSMGPVVPVAMRTETLFNMRAADTALSLSTSSMSLECSRHERRERLLAETKVGVDALRAVYGPVIPTRLGVRYVDVIDKDQIEKDLGRPTSWSALVNAPFLSVPTGLANLEHTLFACEVGSAMPRDGAMTVRYGFLRDADARAKYRLDVDRYIEAPFQIDDVTELLGRFADEVFAVFMTCMGPDLGVWMQKEKG